MKKDIHPKYNPKTKVKCSCGAQFEVGSTVDEINVEICSHCHPLYTGNKKFVDTAGRLDRFQARLDKTKKLKDEMAKKDEEKKIRREGKPSEKKEEKTEKKADESKTKEQ